MKIIFLLSIAMLVGQNYSKAGDNKDAKPDLTVWAGEFSINSAEKKIYFKTHINNIGSAACTINGTFAIQTYLSSDAVIGNDIPSGGKVIPNSFTLEPGKVQIFEQTFYISYQSVEQLNTHPYCVIQIYNPNASLEANAENNKSIYEHGFPREKKLTKDLGNPPTKIAESFIDLKLLISNVTNQLITEPETGKQYREYTYTATIKNIGNSNVVIDLEKPIRLQYWNTISCTDTSGMTSAQRPEHQHTAYVLEPQKSFTLPLRRTRQKPDATNPPLVELIYDSPEKNKWNNFACLQN